MSLLAALPHLIGGEPYCPGGWYSVGEGNVGMVGHTRLVVVSVTVVTEVLIVVVVDGAGASVVVVTGAAVVVGVTVVVGVAVGDTVTVWVVGAGAGAGASDCEVLGADDDVADGEDVVLVPAGVEESEPTNFTTA